MSATAAWDAAKARYFVNDDRVHAVIRWIDESRRDAEASDRRRDAGMPLGPLDGVLVGLKDNIDVAGVPTTAGASFLAGNVPGSDATVIRLLRRQGAVVHAKLNMAELAWGATTQNATYGSCRNPWDLDRIPGGSSGGSGAAIAAGYCDLALGTDTGASVRIPSALNGVVGLRPSVGTISIKGVVPAAYTQDTVGPMAQVSDRCGVDKSQHGSQRFGYAIRDDVREGLRKSLPQDVALKNAPDTDGRFFEVPKVIER